MTKITLRRDPLDFDLNFPRDVERFLSRPFARNLGVFTEEWYPSVDIAETKDEIKVIAEVPGMTKEDISISLQDNVLTLRGEKKEEKEEKGKTFYRTERSWGSFVRSFTLPAAVLAGKVKAVYKNGVLEITLPKAEELKSKEIPILVED
ncbi:MAG TPA: Hsp20/alpha crystallin family protein [candidate division Zixibacteria bacterium]|nr:Hsp20/alpha crystallin family protein [candidate division Zixibacteria bacterium]